MLTELSERAGNCLNHSLVKREEDCIGKVQHIELTWNWFVHDLETNHRLFGFEPLRDCRDGAYVMLLEAVR